jgi:acetyl esterase/lipase
VTVPYGDDPSQRADLYLPAGSGPGLPVAVVIHGGFWLSTYNSSLGAPLAIDLVNHGWAAWNLEYRRIGDGGGWPTTFADVAAGIDALATVGQRAARGRLDLDRVVAVGHSAGGQLAVWAAARPGLPGGVVGSGVAVPLRGAVSQAGVLDLATAAEQRLGGGVVVALLGGEPTARPDRYRLASPISRLPIGVPLALVHGDSDPLVPIAQSERFVAAAEAVGERVEFTRLAGIGHFELIDPSAPAWRICREHLDRFR